VAARLRSLLPLVVTFLPACSGGSFEVPGGDAAIADSGVVDTGVVDSATPDGASLDVGVDVGTDVAVDAAPDAPATWCRDHAGTALFCEDFDVAVNVADLVKSWSGTQGGTGTLDFSTAAGALSPPHALIAQAGNSQQAYVAHKPWPLTTKPSVIRLEFALRVDKQAVGLLDGAPLGGIMLGTNPDADALIYLYIASGGKIALGWVDSLAAGHQLHVSPLNIAPATGTWSGRWGIVVNLLDGGITATHDSATLGKTTSALKAGDMNPSAVTFSAGLPNDTNNVGQVAVAFDDLIFDVK
jgi:hypothetical protein